MRESPKPSAPESQIPLALSSPKNNVLLDLDLIDHTKMTTTHALVVDPNPKPRRASDGLRVAIAEAQGCSTSRYRLHRTCVKVRACRYAYIYTYVDMYIYIHIYICIYACVCVYVYIHIL